MTDLTNRTCTVGPSAVDGSLCGKPAVTSFFTSGRTYFECADHAPAFALRAAADERATKMAAALAHPKTRSRAPFLLVAGGEIVGYAYSRSGAVEKRARKLGAEIVRNINV